ncbi:hypothetical protein KAJ87_02885 [Candidatus Pacearchaeota archaeon]|nr:hypothetical protein [Candidatus Pacearchaeota archaeon]
MKNKGLIIILALFLFSFTFISAEGCDLKVSLINQDPYPAIPNNYVKVVFQMTGVENPECGTIDFEVLEQYPFSLEETAIKTINGNTYVKDYKTEWMIPYKILVDKDALDGENEIEVKYSQRNSESGFSKKFNITIEDACADFELHLKDYSSKTNELTIEILNIADDDVEALTLEIPKQENIKIKGTNRIVVGDLDSNEYTTADFEATVNEGEIEVKVTYTDIIGIRRTLFKTVNFDPDYFKERNGDKNSISIWIYLLILLVIGVIVWVVVKRKKKKQSNKKTIVKF